MTRTTNDKGWGMSISIPAADTYRPYKGVLPDGTEVLVQAYYTEAGELSTLHVAFRKNQWATWGPPTECVPA